MLEYLLINKNEKFNLYYYPSSFKNLNKYIRLTVGKYISNNYNNFCKNELLRASNKKYYNNANIVKSIKYRKNKKDYLKIPDGYIDKKYLIDATYLYLKIPKILNNKKIKLIQIKSYGSKFIIYITYEEILLKPVEEKINGIALKQSLKNIPTINNSISIDTGIKNLMTIYNPLGIQHIIKGGNIKSINEFYNKKIANLQSINKQQLGISKFNRLYSLLNERKNKINTEINKLVDILIKVYHDKKYFIVGYNEGWKTKINLGNKTNRIFYDIPYARIITKLREKLESNNKELIINEESYTSKCDSLNLENLGKNEIYSGSRIHRGLFISKIGKAINADLNGAINIMRKVINLTKINGINLFNPQILVA
jgi:IS605 OrfB family transposase